MLSTMGPAVFGGGGRDWHVLNGCKYPGESREALCTIVPWHCEESRVQRRMRPTNESMDYSVCLS